MYRLCMGTLAWWVYYGGGGVTTTKYYKFTVNRGWWLLF
jgi:hypothetical protein